MIQFAWLWLRYQPGSELAEWFRERRRHVGRAHAADRHCGHGAQAVDRALALLRDRGGTRWRRDPDGDNSHRIDKQELEIAETLGPGADAVLLVDRAGWHLLTRLIVPPNITIIALPPKCPEFNPVENIWHARQLALQPYLENL